MARCEAHGLTFDPAQHGGCAVCRRGQPVCDSCSRPLDPSVAVCPACGAAVAAPVDTRAAFRRRLPLYLGAGAALLVLSGVFLYLGRPECITYGVPQAEWAIEPENAPPLHRGLLRFMPGTPELPHLVLGQATSEGSELYATHMAGDEGHLHPDLSRALHAMGANAYSNQEPIKLRDERYRVVSLALYVHAGVNGQAARAAFAGDEACVISHIVADSAAEAGGLRVGDVVVQAAGELASPRDDCAGVIARLTQVPRGEAASLDVLRRGERTMVSLVRPAEGLYGYRVAAFPLGLP